MGTSFGYLNIQGADLGTAKALCPAYLVSSVMDGWITIVSEELEWGNTQKEAKRLSKALEAPVISTEYFDDDYVEFTLYVGGKRAARHVPASYEDYSRSPGKSKAWAEQLGLPPESERVLQTVFKETDPRTSLDLLACVLQCPLWIIGEWIDKAEKPNPDCLTEYLERKKTEKKPKKQTKLVFLEELSGKFNQYSTYPVIRHEDDGALSFWEIQGEGLQQLFVCDAPTNLEFPFWLAQGKHAVLLSVLSMGNGIDSGPFCLDLNNSDRQIFVFMDNGELIASNQKDFRSHGGEFLDDDHILQGGKCWNFRTNIIEWKLEIEQAVYWVRPICRLSDGRLALVYDTGKKPIIGHLMSFEANGTQNAEFALSSHRHWASPIAWRDRILMKCGKELAAYDSFLNLIWKVELTDEYGRLETPVLDEQTNTLFMIMQNQIVAFDLEKREVIEEQALNHLEDDNLLGIFPGVGPILQTGNSVLQVRNRALNVVAKHRTKGIIQRVIQKDGNTYVITQELGDRTEKGTGNPLATNVVREGCLRLYELKR